MTDRTPTRDEAVPERARIEPLLKDGDVVERLKQFRLRWQENGDLTYLGKALVDAIVEIEALAKERDEARKSWQEAADALTMESNRIDALLPMLAKVESLASAPAPASGGVDAAALDGSDIQLLMRLKFDNHEHGARPVIEGNRDDWTRAMRLSDLGYIAIEQVARGGRLHITRKGGAAVTAFEKGASLSPAATPVSEAGGEAIAFITKLVHMQSGQGWSRAVVRDAAANFLKLHGIAITGHADTTAEIAALAKPGDDDIPTPIRIEDNLDIAMNEFWNAPGGTQGGVRAVLEWVNAVYFPKEGFVRVEHEHAGGAEP